VGTLAVLTQRLGMQTDGPTGALGRGGWLLAAQCLRPLSRWTGAEFGDSRRLTPERGIMTSGYHVCATKPHA
jgi:hypothetical protein